MDQPVLLEQTNPTPTTQGETPQATEQPQTTEAPKAAPSLLNEEAPKTDTPKEGEPPKEEPKTGAPEKYEEFKVEGITLDKEYLEKQAPLFRELGLSQEQAQKIVEVTAKREADIGKAIRENYENTVKGWKDTVTAKYGTNLNNVRTSIGRMLEAVPENVRAPFREAMNVTGAGSHPGFIDAFYELSKLFAEGNYVKPTGAAADQNSGRPRSLGEAIYGAGPATTPQRG